MHRYKVPISFLISILTATNLIAAEEYRLIQRKQLSPDAFLLRFSLPTRVEIATSSSLPVPTQSTLGPDPTLPTCLSITLPEGTDVYGNGKPTQKDISKSYSPISHPATRGSFELIVKGYPPKEGGGVGRFLTHYLQVSKSNETLTHHDNLHANESDVMKNGEDDAMACTDSNSNSERTCSSNDLPFTIEAKLKPPRNVHGSPTIVGRWNHIGLVAGGTGIAPLIQIASLILNANSKLDPKSSSQEEEEEERRTTIHVLYINRNKQDILYKEQLDRWAKEYPNDFSVSYSLTGNSSTISTSIDEQEDKEDHYEYLHGRGSGHMAKDALPSPMNTHTNGEKIFTENSMVFVCGTDGFVKSWGGSIRRAPPKADGSKGPKIQGPLEGWLKEAGFSAHQVFKY